MVMVMVLFVSGLELLFKPGGLFAWLLLGDAC